MMSRSTDWKSELAKVSTFTKVAALSTMALVALLFVAVSFASEEHREQRIADTQTTIEETSWLPGRAEGSAKAGQDIAAKAWKEAQEKRRSTRNKKRSSKRPTKVEKRKKSDSCCRICRKGKACGDGCIGANKNCRKPAGCACDG